MWRQYSGGAISRPPNAVPYGLYVQQRKENSPSNPSRRHSSWKSRVRCRCSRRSSSVSSKPITMVAVVRIPLSTIARCASRYSATVYFHFACRLRKSSVRISLPPPVIQWTPASRSRAAASAWVSLARSARKTNSATVSA